MIELGLLAGVGWAAIVLLGRPLLPDVFSSDPAVVALAGFLLLWVAALQPLNGIAFVLDGLLIGAGDMRFLAVAMVAAMACAVPAAVAVLVLHLGIGWVWGAIGVLMTARVDRLVAALAFGGLGHHRRRALTTRPTTTTTATSALSPHRISTDCR